MPSDAQHSVDPLQRAAIDVLVKNTCAAGLDTAEASAQSAWQDQDQNQDEEQDQEQEHNAGHTWSDYEVVVQKVPVREAGRDKERMRQAAKQQKRQEDREQAALRKQQEEANARRLKDEYGAPLSWWHILCRACVSPSRVRPDCRRLHEHAAHAAAPAGLSCSPHL